MIIGTSSLRSVSTQRPTRAGHQARNQSRDIPPSRALVSVTPIKASASVEPRPRRHAGAWLIAHLLALRDNWPQTRDKRRAEPLDAIKAYQSAAAQLTKANVRPTRSVSA